MLPIGVSAPPERVRPWATAGLGVVLVVVFVHVRLLDDPPRALFCSDLSESAAAVARAAGTVQGFACRYGVIPDDVQKGQHLASLVTAMFAHLAVLHVLANVLFLAAFAPRVEEDLGHDGLLLLFLAAGVTGALAQVLATPHSTDPVLGASGAIAGVLGAHLLLAGRRAQVRVLVGPVPVRLPTWFAIAVWALLQVAYTVAVLRRAEPASATAYAAHVTGFAVGVASVAGRVLEARGRAPVRRRERA